MPKESFETQKPLTGMEPMSVGGARVVNLIMEGTALYR